MDNKASETSKPEKMDINKYLESNPLRHCANVAVKYEKLDMIGRGTFGEVYRAKERQGDKKYVAMKRILVENEKEGFPITALREISILKTLQHENIVNLIETCYEKATANNRNRMTFIMIFDLAEYDLARLLSNDKVKFSLGDIKSVMKQLLEALYYIHHCKIMHRDVKAANILVTKEGEIKLADFGLARSYSVTPVKDRENRYTNRVVTLWYRPPELLLGDRNYGPPVDLWGAGCVMAEMWTRAPIMQGDSESMQLKLMSHLCGSIDAKVWPDVENLKLYKSIELPKNCNRKVKERLRDIVKDELGCDLIDKLLILDPKKRINAELALEHDFFYTNPLPSDLSIMLREHKPYSFEYKLVSQKRQVKRSYSVAFNRANVTSTQSSAKLLINDTNYPDRIY